MNPIADSDFHSYLEFLAKFSVNHKFPPFSPLLMVSKIFKLKKSTVFSVFQKFQKTQNLNFEGINFLQNSAELRYHQNKKR